MSSSDLYESEDDDELSDTPSITPRAAKGTHARALRALRSSLPEESVKSYIQLLHETFQAKLDTREDNFNTTQDGIVVWTPREKRILFEVLDKKGRNGIREIAASIGTKSEPEIQEYIRLLQKGVRRQHFNDTHSRTAILGDIQAAAEISEPCCESLDEYAELLCLEEQREEDNAGKKRHEGLWIINENVAEKLEADAAEYDSHTDTSENDQEVAVRENKTQNEKLASRSNVDAAAAFFKMTNWILLSERFFMNFGGQRLEDNWVNVAFKGETPSLTADVLTDFYGIALSVTRRLVHATHFFASSRVLKNTKASRPSATVVRSSDVRRAARTLNMKSDSSEFWIGLARRCNLAVEDSRHRKGWDPVPLDHDEVEVLLSQRALPKEPYERITPSPSPSPSPSPRKRSNSAASYSSSDSLNGGSDDSEDEHAEAVDRQHSSAEEMLCWTTLGQSLPGASTSQILNDRIPPRPSGKRKTTEELVDWRDRTLYRSEWEEYGYEARKIESEFENQRRKRRLTTSFRPLSKSNNQGANTISPRNKDQTNAEPEYQTDDTDPEFQPLSPERGSKSKVTSRTSSRKRTPMSYAPQHPLDFDMDMEMEIDSESDHENPRDPGNQQDHDVLSHQEGNEGGYHEEKDLSSGSDDHLPNPRERSFSPSDREDHDLIHPSEPVWFSDGLK
ncbi:hypothetical protein BJX76DRAFT_233629 [Aspergillus varians]